MFEYKNYYDVEKYFDDTDCQDFILIPYEYNVGTYKLKDIEYLKYYSDEFIKFNDNKKREILKNYMLWVGMGGYISNGFTSISVTDINDLEVTYKKIDNKRKGMLWQIVNCNNRDDFYRYVENNSKMFEKIIEECADIIYKEINDILEEEYNGREICKMFLDFYSNFEAPIINFTIACEEDIQKVRDKYNYNNYVNEKYKGLKIFKIFVSYREEYDKYIEDILSNSGNYKGCTYELKNTDRIFSYYTSLYEYDYFKNDNICSEFLLIICNKARNKILDSLDSFNISKDFKLYNIEEWD